MCENTQLRKMASNPETSETCPVCLDTVKDPQILACQHKLCSHCLQQHISATAMAGNTYHCPSCNVELKMSDGGAPEPLVAKPSTDEGQVNEPGATAAICTNSDHGPATVFCSDCNESYCQSCASSHGVFKLTRDHSMTPLNKMSPDEIPQANSACNTCTEHEKQHLDILCKRCKTLICKTCALFKHKGHWRQELTDAAKEAKKELEYIVEKTTEYITQQEDKLAEMRLTEEEVPTNVETAKTAVKKAAQQIRDIIDSHETDLLLDLDRHKAKTLSQLESLAKETENNKAVAIMFKEETERLCQSGKTIDQVMLTPTIKKTYIRRRKSQENIMKWKLDITFSNLCDDSLKKMFGNENLELSSTVKTRPEIKLEEHLHQVPIKNDDQIREITGMVVVDDLLCLIHGGALQLHDLITCHQKAWLIPGMKSAQGMALLKSVGRTVVITDTDSDGGKLHVLKISSDLNIAHHRVKRISLIQPVKVTVSRETGQLLIGDGSQAQFIICNEDGDIHKKVALKDLSTWYSEDPGCICVIGTERGYAAIVHDKEHKFFIQWINQDGARTKRYGDKSSNESIGEGKHMIKDSKGRLIVVDHDNHRLHLLDTDGDFLQFLLTEDDGIHNPQCVFLDEASSRLYVAHGEVGSLEVRVYRWPSTSGDVQTTDFSLKLNLGQF